MSEAAAAVLARFSEQVLGLPLPVGIRLWDGSTAGPEDGPAFVLRDREALRRLLWRPGELGLARAWVAGEASPASAVTARRDEAVARLRQIGRCLRYGRGQHGLFWFTGMAPLKPFAVYDSAMCRRSGSRRRSGSTDDGSTGSSQTSRSRSGRSSAATTAAICGCCRTWRHRERADRRSTSCRAAERPGSERP